MPNSVQNPVIRVRYRPDVPGFTVRCIIEAIEASDEAIRASVYHAPTTEERSRQIRRRYQRQLLYRVILTAVICIPTFVIGIVYMNLLPDSSAGKSYLTAPLVSGISRGQFVLLALARPCLLRRRRMPRQGHQGDPRSMAVRKPHTGASALLPLR